MGGSGGKGGGGGGGGGNQQLQRAPNSVDELSQFLQQTGFEGVKNFAQDYQFGPDQKYGMTESGGFSFNDIMGFDAEGNFTNSTSGMDSLTKAQHDGMFGEDWYTQLFSELMTPPEAPPSPNMPPPPGGGGGGGGGPDPYGLWKDEQDRLREEARVAAGVEDRDFLYSNYLDAATAATDYVGTRVAKERSNAALMGIEYDITAEDQQRQVQDYFTSIWAEENQTNLQDLMTEFGDPEGFERFELERTPVVPDADPLPTLPEDGGPRSTPGLEALKVGADMNDRKTKQSVLTDKPTLGSSQSILGV